MRTRVVAVVYALALAACSGKSPLTAEYSQIEVNVDPDTSMTVTLTTWNELANLQDAVDRGQITISLDAEALRIDPVHTGITDEGGAYVATFVRPGLPYTPPQPGSPTSSTITIDDGTNAWTARFADLFTNNLAPTAPLALGPNVFEWRSAADLTGRSTIKWACLEIAGSSAACGAPTIEISQQYIDAMIDAAPGSTIVITGERDVSPESDGNGPPFFAKIRTRFTGTL